MRKISPLLLLIFIINIQGCGGEKAVSEEFRQALIEEVEVLSLYSDQTGTTYRMRILLPEGYSSAIQYPIIYLIDGYYWFEHVSKQIKELTAEGKISAVILVGIGYDGLPFEDDGDNEDINTKRENDLTYPANVRNNVKVGGDALLFYNFIKTNLIPKIESTYSVNSNNRSIFGHSLGGYFTFFQMINFREDALFKNVVSSSPSLWWSSPYIFDLETNINNFGEDLPFNLYLSAGMFEGAEMNDDLDKLESRLQLHSYPNLYFKVDRYMTDHTETGVKAFTDTIELIFK